MVRSETSKDMCSVTKNSNMPFIYKLETLVALNSSVMAAPHIQLDSKQLKKIKVVRYQAFLFATVREVAVITFCNCTY